MSATNQSESAATAQENLQSESVETESATVETLENQASSFDNQADDDNTDEPTISAAEESEQEESGVTFTVNDKRRVETAMEEFEPEPVEADDPDAFEINLDELKLEAESVDREIAELRTKLNEMETKLKESETKRDEALKMSDDFADRFRKAQLQLRVETDEMRARLQRTFDQKLEIARGDVVAGVLDTLDNLQRALAAVDHATDQGAAFEALRDGVKATAEIFENQLKKIGLQAITSEGEPFNPEVHDAVEIASVSKEQDNLVITELQRGYKFGDRLLRPARVKVGRAD